MPMEMSTRESGKKIKPMDMENICTLMEPNMKDIGRKINNMGKEKKHGLTVLATKVTTLRERKMVLVNLNGQMVLLMKANS